jgi:hypothetical protein
MAKASLILCFSSFHHLLLPLHDCMTLILMKSRRSGMARVSLILCFSSFHHLLSPLGDVKQRMCEAFAIPDLALVRGDLMEQEKDFKWTGTAQFVEILSQGYTIGEATQMLKLNVSPLHFAMALLGSRGKVHCTQVREWMGGWSDKGL